MALVTRRTPRQSPPRPIKSDISEVEELARQVADLQRVENPFSYGVTHDIEITTGPGSVTIKHKLGRAPRGWILLRIAAFQPTEFSEAPASADSVSITFQSMLPCTAKVLVY